MSIELKDNKKACILRAAEQEFMQKGFDGARMVEIAKRAGVGHPLLHYHFHTKEELFHSVVNEKMGVLRQSVQIPLEDSSEPLCDRLAKAIECHYDFVRENISYIRFMLNEMVNQPQLFEPIAREAYEKVDAVAGILQQELDAAAARGEMARMEAKMLLEDIITLNVSCFLLRPIVEKISPHYQDGDYSERRKQENVNLIIGRLKCQSKASK